MMASQKLLKLRKPSKQKTDSSLAFKKYHFKKIIMRKLIIATLVTGFISLGFTVVNRAPKTKPAAKEVAAEKIDFSSKLDDKRLASWD